MNWIYKVYKKVEVSLQVFLLSMKYGLLFSISGFIFICLSIYNIFDFKGIFLSSNGDVDSFFKSLESLKKYIGAIFLIFLVSLLFLVIWSVLNYHYNKKRYTYKKVSPFAIKKIKKELDLSDELKDAGYKFYNFKNETYIMSTEVNSYLQDNADQMKITRANSNYKIPNTIKRYVPALLGRKIENSSVVFNGKLLGLHDEIFPGMEDVDCWNVTYFESQVTDEIIYYNLYDSNQSNDRIKGLDLSTTDNKLLPLYLNGCTNYIGISTLLITADGYVILQRQGKKANVNGGNFAPSGSGSVDYKDYKQASWVDEKKNYKKSFNFVLTMAAERELLEEFGLKSKKDLKNLTTKIIGYTRLIERGGKPDFFAVSKTDLNRVELKKLLKDKAKLSMAEQGISEKKKFPVKLVNDPLNAPLDKFIKRHKNQSIQIGIFNEILRENRNLL